jgi:hypothetical protein
MHKNKILKGIYCFLYAAHLNTPEDYHINKLIHQGEQTYSVAYLTESSNTVKNIVFVIFCISTN